MIEMPGSSCHTRIPRDLSPAANLRNEAAYDLVSSQLTFGLAYAKEARLAYRSGRADYGHVARNIALNAYSAVLRFAARLPTDGKQSFSDQLADLQKEVDCLEEQGVYGDCGSVTIHHRVESRRHAVSAYHLS